MIKCGETYYIRKPKNSEEKTEGSETWAGRPGIVISSEENIRENQCVQIVYVTSSTHKKPMSVQISDEAFKYKKNKYDAHQVLCSQIHTVDKSRLGTYYGRVTDEELQKIKKMVYFKSLFD